MRRVLAYLLRIGGSIAIGAAVVMQMRRSIDNERAGQGEVDYVIQNFFSFFTIESNILAAIVLFVGIFTLSGRAEPRGWSMIRAAVTAYMATTGVVYNLLLRGIELPQGATVPWSNEVLHVVGPAVVVLDWLIAPGRRSLHAKALWGIVAFPILWAGYTLARGVRVLDPRTDNPWYPYPFLDPNTSPNGYYSVVFYVVLIAMVIGVVGSGLLWISRVRRRTA